MIESVSEEYDGGSKSSGGPRKYLAEAQPTTSSLPAGENSHLTTGEGKSATAQAGKRTGSVNPADGPGSHRGADDHDSERTEAPTFTGHQRAHQYFCPRDLGPALNENLADH